jgi:PPM family protein phosphatase
MNNNFGEVRPPRVESFPKSDIGRKRKNNEDSFAFYEPTELLELQENGCLYIIADGVGGAARGERVSEYATKKVLYEYYQRPKLDPGDRLRQIMNQVNDEIYSFAERNATRMATTMVAAVIRGNLLTVANVGDSRAYLIRGGEALQLTKDHSIVGELVRNGNMTEEEAQHSKVKNRLSRSLGGESQVHVDLFREQLLQPGDKVLLCTDGLTRYALRADIVRLTSQGTCKEIANALVNFALQRGGGDNISVIMITYEPSGVQTPGLLEAQTLRRPASWEDMLTEQKPITRQPRRRRVAIPKKYLTYLFFVPSILLAIAIVAISLHYLLPAGSPAATGTATPAGTPTSVETPSHQVAAGSGVSPDSPTIAAFTPSETPLPTPTTNEFSTQTATVTNFATSVVFESTATPPRVSCKMTAKPGTAAWGLATMWAGIDAGDQEALSAFYKTIVCAPQPNGGCYYSATRSTFIDKDWVLILPNIPTYNCLYYGGTPQE